MSDTTLILCDLHAHILTEISQRDGKATFDNIQYRCEISRSCAQRVLSYLREREFVVSVRSGCDHKIIHSITDLGQQALDAHLRRRARESGGDAAALGTTVAVANRHSLFDRDEYKPQAARAYCRNDGNAHIASRGLRC